MAAAFAVLFAAARVPGSDARTVEAADARQPSLAAAAGNDAQCAECHAAISARYQETAMARGSGSLADPQALREVPAGSFFHPDSGLSYRVFPRDGRAWFSFVRQPGSPLPDAPGRPGQPQDAGSFPVSGERELRYFIGSGKHGRTYLYQVGGSWFELPINYYTRRQAWGMAPAFDHARTMPADLPTDPNCLHCHATAVAAALPGSRSRYAGAPFAQGGVGCSACHGDASAHLATRGSGPILNPGKLDAARRDSACLGCHLEGDAVVYRPGRKLAGFAPGEDLAETAVYFVRASRTGGGGRAASQYEAMLRSACRRAAGDRLTCTTCHDPHSTPAPAERVAYYRARCLSCHTSPTLAVAHHPEQPDCAHCHMPARATTDISHEQAVDHDIERTPAAGKEAAPRTGEALVPVGGWKSSDRELGLAYAQLAGRGDRAAGERALTLLARAEAAGASDAVLHAELGFLRQMAGETAEARTEYGAALVADPYEATALGNLAVLDATTGQVAEAVMLLKRLVGGDPSQTGAGLNLAFMECRLGEGSQARALLDTLAAYNPDEAALRRFERTGEYAGQRCSLPAPSAGRTP